MNRTMLGAVCLAFCVTGRLGAQTDTRLIEAVRLAREGLGDSARAVAGRVLDTTGSESPLYAEAVFTVAMVASSVETKRLHLQRLAVEFSRSNWADDARLELAQLAYAEQNPDETIRHIERLLSDYPTSPLRARAALWGSRAALDQRQLPLACQWAALGVRAAGQDIELRNRLDFQRQRCEGMMRADTPGGDAEEPAADESIAPPGPGWYVQVVALRSEDAADDVAALLGRADLDPVVVHDAGYFKVRSGPYATRADAERAVAGIRRLAGGNPFVLQVN